MKKKVISLLAVTAIGAFATGVIANNIFEIINAEVRTDFSIKVNGEKKVLKNVDGEIVYPILHDGTTYLPVRGLSEIMGKKVYWYEEEKVIEIKDEPVSTVTDADVIVDTKKEKNDKNKDVAGNKKVKDENKVKEKEKVKEKVVPGDAIGKDKAKEIALEKAGLKESDVKFVEVEYDYEKGVAVYDIEFKHNLKEYNAKINAFDGAIVEWDVDFGD